MKTNKLFQTVLTGAVLLVLTFTIMTSCTQQEDNKLKGTWELVYLKSIAGDTLQYEFPGNISGSQMKMWSKDHFIFVGQLKVDTNVRNNYGGGTYTLKDDLYIENIQYHTEPD